VKCVKFLRAGANITGFAVADCHRSAFNYKVAKTQYQGDSRALRRFVRMIRALVIPNSGLEKLAGIRYRR
jgi:hypothetical protein